MYLKLTKADTWREIGINLQDKHQKDYDYFENGDIEVFIYGYPYLEDKATWLSAADLHHTYLQHGLNYIDTIEGCYTAIVLDQSKQKCFIISDRYGIYTLFYSRQHDSITLSDSIREIVLKNPDAGLNEVSIIEYLNCGLVLGTKTHVQGVNKLRAAVVYTVNNDLQVSERNYWEYMPGDTHKISKEEFLHLFNNHISTGLRLEERISMPLTGGLDSRTVLSACLPAKERLHCYTHGLESSADVRIAREISQTLGISHDFYPLSEEWIESIPSLAETKAETFNGLVDVIRYLHLENSYMNEGGRSSLFFSGVGGELLRAYYAPLDSIDSGSSYDITTALRKRIQMQAPVDAYKDYNEEEIIKILDASVREEVAKTNAQATVTIAERFYIANRIGNFMSYSLKLTGRYLRVFNPFLSKKLLQAVLLLDAREKKSGAIQRYIITSNSPVLQKILLNSGKCLDPQERRMRLKSYQAIGATYLRGGANIISRKLFGNNIFPIAYFVDYASWLRTYHCEYVREVLHYDRMRLKHLFDRRRLETIVNLFLMGRNDVTHYITSLMSLELWLRKVFTK